MMTTITVEIDLDPETPALEASALAARIAQVAKCGTHVIDARARLSNRVLPRSVSHWPVPTEAPR